MADVTPRVCQWTDRNGATLREGDRVIFDSRCGTICYEDTTLARLTIWYVRFHGDPMKYVPHLISAKLLGLTRVPSIRVREFYGDRDTPSYRIYVDGEARLLTDAEHLSYGIAHVMDPL